MIQKEHVIEALKNVYDPEVPVNVYDLGLIYEIQIRNTETVFVKMTMTSPGCPFAALIVNEAETQIKHLTKAKTVEIEITFNPPWDPQTMMSEEAKAQLEMF